MASTWTYQKNGIEIGPISSAELKSLTTAGGIAPGDLVKRDDMPGYVPAARVKGLFPAATNVNAAVAQPRPPAATAAPLPAPTSPSPPPSPAEPLATFFEWYKANLGYQWIFAQGVLWFCYGFIWIPLWWLVTRSSLSKTEAAARIAAPRKPVLSYAISAFFALAFVVGMIRPIVDPEGYKAYKAEQASKAEQQVREAEERRVAKAEAAAAQMAQTKAASDKQKLQEQAENGLLQNPNCPIQLLDLYLAKDWSGDLTFYASVRNAGEQRVEAFSLSAAAFTGFDDAIRPPGDESFVFSLGYQDGLHKYGSTKVTWNLTKLGLPNARKLDLLFVSRVKFSDGSEWRQTQQEALGNMATAKFRQ